MLRGQIIFQNGRRVAEIKGTKAGWNFAQWIFLQLPTISEMTHRERNFQLKVEELLSDISNPEYRQIVVEVFVSYFESAQL